MIVEPLHVETLFAELEPLRRRATRWALDHLNNLGNISPSVPETLHDRAQDLWRPLLAIAEQAGRDWPDRARQSAIALSGMGRLDNSPQIQLLAAVRSIFEKHRTDRLSSETIVVALAQADGASPDRLPSTKAQLARRLTPFGIRPTIVYRSRTQVRRGYLLQDFQDAFARHLPRHDSPSRTKST